MDQMVLQTQQWLNATYGNVAGFQKVDENGKTGWSTVYALTRALQHELGITNLSDNFGPETTSLFKPLAPSDYQTESNMMYILQGSLWCKGIGPGSWTGIFDDQTVETVKNFQADAGLANLDSIVTTPMMKALLNMSAFVLVPNGDSRIREIQQAINKNYYDYIGELQPCDGVYGRNTNEALIYALQKEEGLSIGTANGHFGPSTTNLCPTLSEGDSRKNYVLILQYSLYCNGFDPGDFNGVYGSLVTSTVTNFQRFMVLPETGVANMTTIKGLLSSAGDTNRDALACDTATILTASTAQAIKNVEFDYVGRYLTGTVTRNGASVSKALTRQELNDIFSVGLKVFPIYEDGGYELSHFTSENGLTDAQKAIDAALDLGLPQGTTIYFAVDFDALDEDITNNILPYFSSVKDQFDSYYNNDFATYTIGVYGARNICNRVSNAGYAVRSFVADMSTGWSGNLGFTMPDDWAFDQFNTITVGNSTLGFVSVDMVAYKVGNDPGVSTVIDQPTNEDKAAKRLSMFQNIKEQIPTLKNFPTTQLAIGQEYTQNFGRVTITLEAVDTFQFTTGNDVQHIWIKKGDYAAGLSNSLGSFQTDLGLQDNGPNKLINNIAQTVNFGDVFFKYIYTAESIEVDCWTQYQLPLNTIYPVGLQMYVKMVIDNTPDPNESIVVEDTVPIFTWGKDAALVVAGVTATVALIALAFENLVTALGEGYVEFANEMNGLSTHASGLIPQST